MHHNVLRQFAAGLLGLVALIFGPQPAVAFSGIGLAVDNFCTSNGRQPATPYNGDCLLCHLTSRGSGARQPQYDWSRTGDYGQFCPQTLPQPPNGTINAPDRNITVMAGTPVQFQGSGTDPDNNTPLVYQWDFGGGAANRTGAGPHTVSFGTPGTFTVSLTVVDSGGLADPTPATRTVTVTPAVTCTDADADGFALEGGACGPVDCDDRSYAVNPNATELCTDGIDNNCDGRVDVLDPFAVGCAGCIDDDGDQFSPEGGICGPVDCNDRNPDVNPGVDEICDDGTDNDCDGLADAADSECNGSDCIDALLRNRLPPDALRVSFESSREPWLPLEGSMLTEDVFIFVPEADGIVEVRYWLDDELRQTDTSAPWDFAGGSDTAALPFDTLRLTNGVYTVLAEVDFDDGITITLNAAFTIANVARPTVPIDRASWNARERELEVEGRGFSRNDIVRIFNADTGVLLGTAEVEYEDGVYEWEFERERPATVPCRVRAEIGDQYGIRAVTNAPADCDGGAPANRAPTPANDTAATDEDAAVSIPVLANDTDPDGDSLTVTAVTQGSLGAVQLSAGAVTYSPNPGVSGTDQFTYTVSDGKGGTATASVRVTIRPINDPPVAIDDSATTNEDGLVTIAVLANDSDPDGDSLTITAVTQGSLGTVHASGGTLVYTPRPNANGPDQFTYTVSDGNDGTASATVRVTIRPVNDAPSAVDDVATTPAGEAVTIAVLTNDSDVDGDGLSVSFVGQPASGTASTDGAAVTYVPSAGFSGTDSFGYTVADGNGGSASAQVTVTVQAPPPDIEVEIESARWNARRSLLVVEGEDAPPGAIVLVYNPTTQERLGATRVQADGEWRVRALAPDPVPCSVYVMIRTDDQIGTGTAAVRGAPQGCR